MIHRLPLLIALLILSGCSDAETPKPTQSDSDVQDPPGATDPEGTTAVMVQSDDEPDASEVEGDIPAEHEVTADEPLQSEPVTNEREDERVEHEESGFSLIPPVGWEPQAASRGSVILNFIAPVQLIGASVNVVAKPNKGAELHQLREFVKTDYAKTKKAFELLSDSDIKIDGHDGFFLAFTTTTPAAGLPTKVAAVQYCTQTQQRLFIITCISPPQLFDKLQPEFERCANSIRLK